MRLGRVCQYLSAMSDISEIINPFELLGDRNARYQHLVELGEGLEPMPA